jgi:NitT/TauT family transport system permease protein
VKTSARTAIEPVAPLALSPPARLSALAERFVPPHVSAMLWPAGFALALLLAWQAFVRLSGVPDAILPAPSAVLDQLLQHYPIILRHAVPTTVDTLMAFGIAIPLGVALAALITWSETAKKAIYPNVIVFQLIPKIALAPLFIVWLGIGSPSRVTFSVFICFFPILVSTATGLEAVSRDLVRLCRSLGATDRQVLLTVRFPTALPFLFSGMKVAVTLAIIGVVVGEFIASQEGLGYLILFASSRQQTDLSLACIAVLCAVGLSLYGLVVLAERRLAVWFGDR